jgi:hypothetical protein
MHAALVLRACCCGWKRGDGAGTSKLMPSWKEGTQPHFVARTLLSDSQGDGLFEKDVVGVLHRYLGIWKHHERVSFPAFDQARRHHDCCQPGEPHHHHRRLDTGNRYVV